MGQCPVLANGKSIWTLNGNSSTAGQDTEPMCVVALAWKAHPRWMLVVAGNRDEFHARQSAPLAQWSDHPHLLAGRDLVSGGTWLGVSTLGRLAVVTNVSGCGEPDPALASRGALVTHMVHAHAKGDPALLSGYNPFNLLVADQDGAILMTNRPKAHLVALKEGTHSLSNGQLDCVWPRKDRLEQALTHWLTGDVHNPRELFSPLSDEVRYDGPEGAPIKIRNDFYGTRCSTIVAIDHQGRGFIAEKRFGPDGNAIGETELPFSWSDP